MLEEKMVALRETLIIQANLVEKMLDKCIKGIVRNESALLDEVIASDEKSVNQLEIDIDGLCMNIFALFHPEAKDLRATMMISKMTSDLERMADCAVNISESARFLTDKPLIKPYRDLPKMAEETIAMVRQSIASFIDEDIETAKKVCENDSKIDDLRDKIWQDLAEYMCADSSTIERALHLLRIANNLEKIADISTNIAEETIYIARGIVIKHHKDSI
jgi:phosphate transport system protein